MRAFVVVLSVVLSAFVPALSAETEWSGFLGVQFFDMDEVGQETSPTLGARFGWAADSGHGLEVTIDYTKTRNEVGVLGFDDPFGVSIDVNDTEPGTIKYLRLAADYKFFFGEGLVQPYLTVGLGFVRGKIDFTSLERSAAAAIGVRLDDDDSALTYGAGFGFLIGEGLVRFRYDMRLIAVDDLFDGGTTTNPQLTGGVSWVLD